MSGGFDQNSPRLTPNNDSFIERFGGIASAPVFVSHPYTSDLSDVVFKEVPPLDLPKADPSSLSAVTPLSASIKWIVDAPQADFHALTLPTEPLQYRTTVTLVPQEPDLFLTPPAETGLNQKLGSALEHVAAIRSASKLGAKFFKDKHGQLGDGLMSLCSISYDVGLILTLAGESRDLIAGILHNAFSTKLERDVEHVKRTITRKFGAGVTELISFISDPATQDYPLDKAARHVRSYELLTAADRDTGTLLCSISTALIEAINRKRESGASNAEQIDSNHELMAAALAQQCQEFTRLGISPVILGQFKNTCARFCQSSIGHIPQIFLELLEPSTQETPGNILHLPQLLRDAQAIRNAAQFSSDLFENVSRKWGPDEQLPLSAHQYEVGMLLALAGAPKEVIVAGVLHDAFEGYVDHDVEKLSKYIAREYGREVVSLISLVTEPPKASASENWWQRKLAVLRRVQEGGCNLATLVCATKISTIGAGNKMLYMGRPVTDWSSGSLEDNVKVFDQYLREFEKKGVAPILLAQFRAELALFQRGTIERQGRAAREA